MSPRHRSETASNLVSESTSVSRVTPPFVVAIGSSAGGLEALTQLLSSLASGVNAVYVVAQHLAPDHDSSLVELLSRATDLEVVQSVDGTVLRAGRVIVASPGTDVRIDNDVLSVTPSGEGPGPNPSIDQLMSSLAHGGRHVVGILLSGTGSDGSLGLRDLHSAGGVIIVQEPATAKFPGMPESAIATGLVDLVLRPEQMGQVIARLGEEFPELPDSGHDADSDGEHGEGGHTLTGLVDGDGSVRPLVSAPTELAEILTVLTAVTGVNFGEYKDSTLIRQCMRRQVLTGMPNLGAYRDLLHRDADEVKLLGQALLVGVTSFFRDADVWDALTIHLQRTIHRDRDYRVWVAGCATGEEAYTVAMIVASIMGVASDRALPFKVFATDLSESSLEIARRGHYSDDAVVDIPVAFRDRWMQRSGQEWVVKPILRDAIIFARHDMTSDPPFPQIDLITLRNTLIYFKPSLQRRVIEMCHFALEPGGTLVLGTSERPNDGQELFVAEDQDHRIYTRLPGPSGQRWVVKKPARTTSHENVVDGVPDSDVRQRLLGALVAGLLPPGLVVDQQGDVIEVLGDVTPWCRLAPGQLSRSANSFLNQEFRQPVRQMLIQARHSGESGVTRDVETPSGVVRITARSLGALAEGIEVVTFVDVPQVGPVVDDDSSVVSRVEFDRVTDELHITEAALQVTIEELETSNEELRSLNEELQASAEEIQASTEEVQASNEELEANNEQLNTLNRDLETRSDALFTAKTELENIQSSLTSGLVIVDRNLRISKFTPLSVRLFPLIESDLGRPLLDIPTSVAAPGLEAALRSTVLHGERVSMEVSSKSQDFLVQIAPYVVNDGSTIGALLTISDVTDLLSARRRVAQALEDFELITDSLRETVVQRDSAGVILFLNSAVERMFGLSRPHVLAEPELLLEAIHPDDRTRVSAAAEAAAGRWDVQYRIVRPDGTIRFVEESALTTAGGEHHGAYSVASILDVTERVEAQERADAILVESQRRNDILRALLESSYLGLVILDGEGRILQINDCFGELIGLPAKSLIGTSLASLIPNFDGPEDLDAAESMWSEPGVVHRVLRTHDGRSLWVAVSSRPIEHDDASASSERRPAAWVVSIHDLTRIRDHTGELVMQARFDQLTGSLTRAHFRDRLNEELARDTRNRRGVAVLWIDLDGFKDVNDRHGHRAGDAVLREVATRLEGTARRQDFVGRLGGDEFAMIVTEFNNLESLETVATRVLAVLRNPIPGPDGLLYITASIGIAVGPDDGPDADSLMHSADVAMYVAKDSGRDTHAYFQGAMNDEAEHNASQRHDLTEAIRSHDFELAYQPVVDMNGHIVMAEALVRWKRNGELVPASEFIDTIKDSGQLRPLGQIVLGLIDADLKFLDGARPGDALPITVNISPEELEARDLVKRVMDWDPPGGFGRIVVEVTEATLMAYQGHAVEALRLLRRLGATIAIDDFGTGFSNLSMLERLEPKIIKIDRSLLVSAESGDRARAILDAAVGLGRALGAQVVMEGVETQAQSNLSTKLGVDLLQGFYIARPMPIGELVHWSTSSL